MHYLENWPMWLTLAVAFGLLFGLAFRVASTDLLAVAGLAILIVAQNVSGTDKLPSSEDMVAGFGNQGLVTIAFLFAVVTGLELTGGTQLATGWLLDKAKGLRDAQIRMLVPVAAISGFLNNTPIVAALMPVANDLSKRLSISSSRLLLPLSYAAILGGMCTLMGTSTNLLVNQEYNKAIQKSPEPESFEPMGFFLPAVAGLPVTIIGLSYIVLFSKWLLPDRKPAISVSDDPQKYTVEMQIDPVGPLVGKTLQAAGLRALPGLYVAEIQRADGRIEAAKPDAVLGGNDVLILVGAVDSVVDLRKIRGLITSDDQARKLQIPAWKRTLVEAVVSPRCSLIGKTIREGKFRSNFNAAVVAVARGQVRLAGKLGDVRIESGDVLLLEASPSFLHQQRGGSNFYLVSGVANSEVRRHEKAWLSIAILAVMVIVSAVDFLSIMTASMLATLAMLFFRCCTTREARRSIDWSVLIVIGAAIGIGRAMDQSGAAKAIAAQLLQFGGGSPMGTMIAIYLATVAVTELITNNAAAMLMFWIAWEAADKLNMEPMPMVIAVMVGASASFITPFGYQTNTMVYGVGGYSMRDYVVFGAPLSALVGVTALTSIGLWYGLISF